MKTITNENYFETDEYMSVSAFKKLKRCEVDGLEAFGNPTDSMLIGSYVDAYIEGTLEQFKKDNPQLFTTKIEIHEDSVGMVKEIDPSYITRNDTFKGDKLAEAKRLFPHCFNITTELKSDFVNANEICKFIDNDEVFSQFMSGEKQTIMVGEIAGVPFKIKMDSYSKGIAINDLKVMRTVTNSQGEFYDFITPWGYDIQMACYQEIVRQNTGEQLPCYICAVTKETPINSVIVHIPQDILNRALYTVESELPHLYDVKMNKVEPIGCGKCKSCISRRKSTPIISMSSIIE